MIDSEQLSGSDRLRRGLRLVIVGGCLATVYGAGVSSPLATRFLLDIGANERHIGILSGVSMWMVTLTMLGAFISNRLARRKVFFMINIIVGRLLYLPVVFLPLLLPPREYPRVLAVVIMLMITVNAMHQVTGPAWLSWMSDLAPRRVLNTYWGTRQRWLHLTSTFALLAVAGIRYLAADVDVRSVYPIMVVVGVIAGVVDIILFAWVEEPRNSHVPAGQTMQSILAPFRDPGFRGFILFQCTWQGVAMFAATFMQVYVLKTLGLSDWLVTLIWCSSGLGVFAVSRFWGRVADRFGQRPILVVCISLKMMVVFAFILINARTAVYILPPVFLIDSMINAGTMVASNGFTMKIAPRENRSFFIAAASTLPGLCGGFGAIIGGYFLAHFEGWHLEWLGRTWNNYHLLFAVDIPLRGLAILMAWRIVEPKSASPMAVVNAIRSTFRQTAPWPLGQAFRPDNPDEE